MSTVGGTTVLVVEDEPLVRLSVRYYLERHGYVVVEAGGMNAALRLLGECHVDLLLTDLALPEGHGLDLARRARELVPEIRLLLMSAYPLGRFDLGRPGLEADRVLQKPFTESDLLAYVKQCLMQR